MNKDKSKTSRFQVKDVEKRNERRFLHLEEKVQLLFAIPNFRNSLIKIREKWKIPAGGFEELETYLPNTDGEKWRMKLIKNASFGEFSKDVQALRKKFGLNNSFDLCFEDVVIWNNCVSLSTQAIFKRRTLRNGKLGLFIQVFPRTTFDDLLFTWDRVKEYIAKFKNNLEVSSNERSKMVSIMSDLAEDGYSQKGIFIRVFEDTQRKDLRNTFFGKEMKGCREKLGWQELKGKRNRLFESNLKDDMAIFDYYLQGIQGNRLVKAVESITGKTIQYDEICIRVHRIKEKMEKYGLNPYA